MEIFDVSAKNRISYFQGLLSEFIQNTCFKYHHRMRLENYSKDALEIKGGSSQLTYTNLAK